MAIFTVHVPPNIADPTKRADRTVFVRDGFSFPATLFGPVFLVYRRLWVAALGWIVAAALLAFLCEALDFSGVQAGALFLLLMIATGLEASTLRQSALARRGYIFAGLLAAPSREDAERAFFGGEAATSALRPAATGGRMPDPRRNDDIIGLFPRAGDFA